MDKVSLKASPGNDCEHQKGFEGRQTVKPKRVDVLTQCSQSSVSKVRIESEKHQRLHERLHFYSCCEPIS